MSKKKYSPLTPEELFAQHEAKKAKRQALPESEQFSQVESRHNRNLKTFSDTQGEAYKQATGREKIDADAASRIKLPHDIEAIIEEKLSRIPESEPELREKKKEQLTKLAEKEQAEKEEAETPTLVKQVREEYPAEVAQKYEADLNKQKEIAKKSAPVAAKKAGQMQASSGVGAFGGLLGSITEKLSAFIPETWGMTDQEKLEYNKLKDETFKVEAPIAEKNLQRAREEKLALEKIYNSGDIEDMYQKRIAKTAIELKDREIRANKEFLTRGGFWDKIENHLWNIGSGGAVKAVEDIGVILPVALKAQNNPDSLTEVEKELLKAYASEQQTSSMYAERAGVMARQGDGLGHSLSFLVGIGVTSGVGGAAKTGVTKLAGRFATNTATKVGAEVAGMAAQAAAMPGTYSQYATNKIGIIEYDRERNKIMLNEQIAEDFSRQLNKQREHAKIIRDKYRPIILEGGNLTDEEKALYYEAKGKLGEDPSYEGATFDELEAQVEKQYPEAPGALSAYRHALGSSMAELFAEKFIGKGLSKVFDVAGRKLIGNAFRETRLGMKYYNFESRFQRAMDKTPLSGTIQGLPEEFAEEVFVAFPHALNDWSIDPLLEWYDPEKGFNTQMAMDVGIQTLIMGGGFRAASKVGEMASWAMNPEEYKKSKQMRKDALTLFNNIQSAKSDNELAQLIDLKSSKNLASINEKLQDVKALRDTEIESNIQQADLMEKRIFTDILQTAVQTGTLPAFQKAINRMTYSPNLSVETKANALKLKGIVDQIAKGKEKYDGLLNSHIFVQREAMRVLGQENVTELNNLLTRDTPQARQEWERIQSAHPEFADISLEDIGNITMDEAKAKKLEQLVEKENYADVKHILGLKRAKTVAEEFVESQAEANRKESSPEHQKVLKGKLEFQREFNKKINNILRVGKRTLMDVEETDIDVAMEIAEKKIKKKGYQFTELDKRTISAQMLALAQQNKLVKEEAERQRAIEESRKNNPAPTTTTTSAPTQSSAPAVTPPTPEPTPGYPLPEELVIPKEDNASLQGIAQDGAMEMGELISNSITQENDNPYANPPEAAFYDGPNRQGGGIDLDDIDELPENSMSPEMTAKAAEIVKKFYEEFQRVYGRKPSFQEYIEEIIKYNSLKVTEALFPVYVYGWEANGYPKVKDADLLYEHYFNPLQNAAQNTQQELLALTGMTPEEVAEEKEAVKEQQEKAELKAVQETDDVIIRDNDNLPVKREAITSGGHKTGSAKSKMGFNAIDYITVVDESGKSKKESVNTKELKESEFLDIRELLEFDKFNPGHVAGVMVVPEVLEDDTDSDKNKNLWDIIQVLSHYNEHNEPQTIPFSEWLKEKEKTDPNFRNTQDFRDMVPIAILGTEGQPVAFVHDTAWFNTVNMVAPGEEGLTEITEDSLTAQLIQKGKENIRQIRNKIILDGATEIKVTEKQKGVFNRVEKNSPLITLQESNPQSILAVQVGTELQTAKGEPFVNDTRVLLNDPEEFNKIKNPNSNIIGNSGSKLATEGYVWNIVRVGTEVRNGAKIETYQAFLAQRKTDNGVDNGVREENLETLRWMFAAQLRTKYPNDYKKRVQGTKYELTEEEATKIQEDIFDKTGIDIFAEKGVLDFFKLYSTLRPKTTFDNLKKALFGEGNKAPLSASEFAQHTDLNFLGSNPKVIKIGDSKVVEDAGTYQEMLKNQLFTNIQGINIGTEDKPMYVTHPQPSITFEINDEATSEKPEINFRLKPVNPPTLSPIGTEDVSPVAEGGQIETPKVEDKKDEENQKKIDDYINKVEEFFRNELQIKYNPNLINRDNIDVDELPGDITDLSALQNILKITENLTVKQEGQLVEFLFNNLLTAIDAKYKTRVSKEELLSELEGTFTDLTEAYLDETENIIEQLEGILAAYPDNKKVQVALNNANRAKTIYDSIFNNWDSIGDKAVEKVIKYTEIREVENDERTEEQDTTINGKENWSASSLEEGSKDKTSYALKRFMAGIPVLTNEKDEEGKFKQKRGFLGVPLYMSFDEVYNSIAQFYAGNIDIPSDYNDMISILRTMEDRVPWVAGFLAKLEAADDQLKNQFVTTYARHSLSMKFTMYSKDVKDNSVNIMSYDANAHEISRTIINKWKTQMGIGSLINGDVVNKEAAKTLYNKYHALGANKHLASDEDLRDFLEEFGIVLSNEAWEELKAGRFYNGRTIPFRALFTDQSGLFTVLENTLLDMMNMPDEHTNLEQSPEHHPFLKMNNVLKGLAKIDANYTVNGVTLNFRNGGKLINAQVPPKYATDRISQLKRDAKDPENAALLNHLLKSPIASQNTFLNLLANNKDFAEKFGMSHLALEAFKELGKTTNPEFSSITKLNDMDHEYTKLGLLQDINQGELKTTGIPMRMAKMFFPTMSDKDQMLLLHTAIYDFSVDSSHLFAPGTTDKFALGAKKLIYDKLVKAELMRIIDFHVNVKDVNIEGYNEFAQVFNFIPELNNVKDKNGMRAIAKIQALASDNKDVDTILSEIEAEFKTSFQHVAEQFIHQEAAIKEAEWTGTIIKTKGEQITSLGFNQKYLDRMGTKIDLKTKAKIGIYDYVLNSILTNHDIFTGIAGDPAMYGKGKDFVGSPYNQTDTFYSEVMEKTGVNIGKRLALLIAPGTKIANSKNEKYNQLFLEDANDIASNMEYLIKLFYGEDKLTKTVLDELTTLRGNATKEVKKELRKKLQKQFPNIADYLDIESTDAQEYTTLAEHVHIMNQQGRLSPEMYATLQDVIKNNKPVPKELLGVVLQPIKPVYTGQVMENGIMRTVYIKSSSFPLIKEMTAGTQLDALRQKMEEIEKKTGKKVRASYQSANKVGAVKNPINILDPMSLANAESAMLELNRNDFRIQQDVPFKSDKKGPDTISMGTQIFKLLMGDGMLDEQNFNIDGRNVDGKTLRNEFNEAFGGIVRTKKKELYKELGLDRNGRPINRKITAMKLQELLKTEALKRNYPLQDMKNLEIQEKNHEGNVYYEFITPLWLSTNSVRFESMLNAIVTKRLMQHKLPGASFVAASEHGMAKQMRFSEDQSSLTENQKSRIIYLNGWNGKELQGVQETTVDGEVKFTKAQVFAPSKIKNAQGKLVDLFEGFNSETGKGGKYIERNEQGNLVLKKDMIDPEMFNMFSFRTPTSSHVSASSIELVGILPPELGDLMMVPKNFTKQKGLDYDVDKEYTYILNHIVHPKSGKVEVLSEKHKEAHLKHFEKYFLPTGAPADISKEDAVTLYENLVATGMSEKDAETFVYSNQKAQEKIEKVTDLYERKLHENKFIKIHLAVYNNPSKNVQQRINKVLSMAFAQEQAELIEGLNKESQKNSGDKQFSILSDSYQRKKMALGAAGKLAIGVYSNYVTAHGLIQQNDELVYMRNSKGNPKTIRIGTWSTDKAQRAGYGNIMTLDGSRTIAEVFAEKQNTATDNEKEQILGRVNVNGYTINVDAYMTLLGFDKDIVKMSDGKEVEVSIPYMLLSQPIIKEYVRRLQEGRGTTSDFVPNLEKKVIGDLAKEYGSNALLYENGQFSDDRYLNDKLTGRAMMDGITQNGANQEVQLAALSAFLQLSTDAKRFSSSISLINTNDLGVTLSETSHLHKQLESFAEAENKYIPGSARIQGITDLIGKFAYKIPEGENADDWVKIGRRYIKPTTAQGHLLVHGIQAGTELWSDYFPYMDPVFEDIMDQIYAIGEIDLEKAYSVNEENQDIIADVKKYIYSIKSNGLFNQVASEERQRLFKDTPEQHSLATYMMTILKGTGDGIDLLKSNRLISKFVYEPRFDGRPSLIKFNNVDKSTFDEDYLYNSLTELILDDMPLPDFNGRPYSTKKLAQDLIVYAYVEGGTQQAIQFIKYVPIEYLTGVKVPVTRKDGTVVMQSVNEIMQTYNSNRNTGRFQTIFGQNTVHDVPFSNADQVMNFVMQYFQHHPEKTKQFDSKKEAKNPVYHDKELISFNYVPKNPEDLDNMKPIISKKNRTKSKKKQDKWSLYKHVGNGVYTRIDVLGDHGMNEYEFKNPKKKENAKTIISPAPTLEVQKQLQKRTQVKSTIPFGIEDGDTVKTVLEKLSRGDMQEYAHTRQMAEFLMPFADHNTTLLIDHAGEYFKGDRKINVRGTYNSNKTDLSFSEIIVNGAYTTDSDNTAKVFFHEFIHSVTKRELAQYFEADGFTLKKDAHGKDAMPPNHILRINSVFREFRKQYESELPAFQKKLEARKKGALTHLDDYEKTDLYAASSIFEFVAVMMTEPDLQKRMKKVSYKATDKSIFRKFSEAIVNLLKAIHPASESHDNITDESIAAIIEVIQAQHTRFNPPAITGTESPAFMTDVENGPDIQYPSLEGNYGEVDNTPAPWSEPTDSDYSYFQQMMDQEYSSQAPIEKEGDSDIPDFGEGEMPDFGEGDSGDGPVDRDYLIESDIPESIISVFENHPELAKIGNEIDYAEYIRTLFPESEVKDIVAHVSRVKGIEKFKINYGSGNFINSQVNGTGVYFAPADMADYWSMELGMIDEMTGEYTKDRNVYYAVLNSKNRQDTTKNYVDNADVNKNTDVVVNHSRTSGFPEEYIVKDPDIIHILGSKKDIKGFEDFMKSTTFTDEELNKLPECI